MPPFPPSSLPGKAGRNNTYLGSNEDERSLARSLVYGVRCCGGKKQAWPLSGPPQAQSAPRRPVRSPARGPSSPFYTKKANELRRQMYEFVLDGVRVVKAPGRSARSQGCLRLGAHARDPPCFLPADAGHEQVPRRDPARLAEAPESVRADAGGVARGGRKKRGAALRRAPPQPTPLPVPPSLAVTTESDDLGLGPGVSFTFGDVAMYEALVQASAPHVGSAFRAAAGDGCRGALGGSRMSPPAHQPSFLNAFCFPAAPHAPWRGRP